MEKTLIASYVRILKKIMIRKKFKDYHKVLLKQIKDNRKEYNETIDKCKKLNAEHEKLIALAKIEGLDEFID